MSTHHKYRTQRLYTIDVKRIKGGLEITVIGENTKGNRIDFAFPLSWSYLPYVFLHIRRCWRDERSERILELNDLDRQINPSLND